MTRGTSKKGPKKKKTGSLRLRFRGDFSRWCFFFCCGPADAHSLTAVLGGDASRRGGVFFDAAPPGPGWCFFLLGRFRQGPGVWFFFLLRPRRTRRANNKKSLVYYIGSKKTRRGHSKKKTPLPPLHPKPDTLSPKRLHTKLNPKSSTLNRSL